MKNSKLLVVVLCLIMIMSVFAGCTEKTDAPETQSEATDVETENNNEEAEPVVLKLGIWPEPSLTEEIVLHEGYVETMNALHSDVVVEPAYYKYATDTFVSMAEAGNLPTVFETWYTEPQKLIAGEFVADITDILEERGWLDSINPSISELLSKDGRIYGIPRDGYALGLMVNVALFKEAGVVDADGYPIYPKTWEELAVTAKKIKDETGQPGLCLLAKDNAGGWHFSNIAWSFGATMTIDNGDGTFTADLDSSEAIAAMEYIKSLKWEYDVLTPDPTNEDWGTGFTAIGTGTAAMYIAANDAVNQPTAINGLPLDDLGLCAFPAGPGGQYSLSGGTPYMFSKDATVGEINAALDYLEIMGKAPVASDAAIAGMQADAQYRVDTGIPIIPRFPCWISSEIIDAEAAIIAEYSNVDAKLFDTYFDATTAKGNLRMEEVGSAQDLYAEVTKVLQAVITDKDADVAELMKQADTNYQSILDGLFPGN